MARRNFTDSEEEQIAKIYLAGHSARAIARAYGKDHHISIVAALKRQGVEQRSPGERNRLYALNPHVFDTIDNELAAYFLGYLFADGCVSRNKTLGLGIKWSDKELLVGLKTFLESEAPIKSVFVCSSATQEKKYRQATFEATERHLASRLMELGIIAGRPSHEQMIKQTPPNLYNHLIRGYFDGDGSARKPNATRGGSIVFCGSKELMIWIRDLIAMQAGTNPRLKIQKHNTANLHYLYFSGTGVALKVARYMYKDATFWLARKKKVIESWPALKPRVIKRNEKGRFVKTDPN